MGKVGIVDRTLQSMHEDLNKRIGGILNAAHVAFDTYRSVIAEYQALLDEAKAYHSTVQPEIEQGYTETRIRLRVRVRKEILEETGKLRQLDEILVAPGNSSSEPDQQMLLSNGPRSTPRLGWKVHGIPEKTIDAVRQYVNSRVSLCSLAELSGQSAESLQKRAQQYGIPVEDGAITLYRQLVSALLGNTVTNAEYEPVAADPTPSLEARADAPVETELHQRQMPSDAPEGEWLTIAQIATRFEYRSLMGVRIGPLKRAADDGHAISRQRQGKSYIYHVTKDNAKYFARLSAPKGTRRQSRRKKNTAVKVMENTSEHIKLSEMRERIGDRELADLLDLHGKEIQIGEDIFSRSTFDRFVEEYGLANDKPAPV